MEHRNKIEKHIESRVEDSVQKGFKIFFFIVLGVAIAFLVGYILMQLWNWLMPDLFDVPTIGYWQAIGILILAKIIFGFGGGDGPGKSHKSKKRSRKTKCGSMRKDFSEWKYYDEFWKEEGEKAFNEFVERQQNESQ